MDTKNNELHDEKEELRKTFANILFPALAKVSAEQEKLTILESRTDTFFDALATATFSDALARNSALWTLIREEAHDDSALLFRSIFTYGRLIGHLERDNKLDNLFSAICDFIIKYKLANKYKYKLANK